MFFAGRRRAYVRAGDRGDPVAHLFREPWAPPSRSSAWPHRRPPQCPPGRTPPRWRAPPSAAVEVGNGTTSTLHTPPRTPPPPASTAGRSSAPPGHRQRPVLLDHARAAGAGHPGGDRRPGHGHHRRPGRGTQMHRDGPGSGRRRSETDGAAPRAARDPGWGPVPAALTVGGARDGDPSRGRGGDGPGWSGLRSMRNPCQQAGILQGSVDGSGWGPARAAIQARSLARDHGTRPDDFPGVDPGDVNRGHRRPPEQIGRGAGRRTASRRPGRV